MKLPEPREKLSDTPKRIEVLVGTYPQQEYGGVYEREDEMLNGKPIYVQINQMRWCVEHNKPLYMAANKKCQNFVQYVARHRAPQEQ
ncbi:Oidioi.mRNA.OKI2018_I69.PAR.g10573.t1.cds [Oikopleura dioica]|uniref:Oidioi.mRNA.OKI2018_I69.PAR.g10573.t1.cds n=1 Tax=Oikopleura dioica TaxID=34765 RepID=A0ABN7RWZ1_OIKDI|nr:Oidioi.mRNA.OKI2018_I69.PAR.g10573.t1.cds [Oikopleura dioica]